MGKLSRQWVIAVLAVLGIAIHLLFRFGAGSSAVIQDLPLWTVLVLGGIPLVLDLLRKLIRQEFGSDLLAGISIVTSIFLGEYLAGSLVVLMLSGGEALEAYAVRSASSVLEALARRMPSTAHRRDNGSMSDISLDEVSIGDTLVVMPHEACPVDGTVLEGHGSMDESFLTGEPYIMSKAPGVGVLSGAMNGDNALVIRADKLPIDSRYAKIMKVMRESEQRRPQLRRLGDQLGAFYTPLALVIALSAWWFSGDPIRFLAVMVVATPCPLLIAIPVTIIGAISLAARHSIIIKDPTVLERIDTCRIAIFDKTGTLTYGRPALTDFVVVEGWTADEALALTASLERYSKHPLSTPILEAASEKGLKLQETFSVQEPPGYGLRGEVDGHRVVVTNRKGAVALDRQAATRFPGRVGGMECIVLIDGQYAATFRFRDRPRVEGAAFIRHLGPMHQFDRVLLVSGDQASEVQYLADQVGIHEVYASQSPEQKLELVRRETAQAPTVFLGDGINDAPALTAATVGLAFGQNSDITTEAAGAVILDSSLQKVDELFHIARFMRRLALQSAVGGMLLSVFAMGFAAAGYLPPVAGAVLQEIIDVVAVLNALRIAFVTGRLDDFETH